MKITLRRCPVLAHDLVFVADDGTDALVVRGNGYFFKGKEVFGADLAAATNLRSSLHNQPETGDRAAAACELVTKHPNPFASPASRAAWGIVTPPSSSTVDPGKPDPAKGP